MHLRLLAILILVLQPLAGVGPSLVTSAASLAAGCRPEAVEAPACCCGPIARAADTCPCVMEAPSAPPAPEPAPTPATRSAEVVTLALPNGLLLDAAAPGPAPAPAVAGAWVLASGSDRAAARARTGVWRT